MEPVTRTEKYLAAIANMDVDAELPEPITREERYLYAVWQAVVNGGGGGEGGTTNYNALSNKPKINGVELKGNLYFDDIVPPMTSEEIDQLMSQLD